MPANMCWQSSIARSIECATDIHSAHYSEGIEVETPDGQLVGSSAKAGKEAVTLVRSLARAGSSGHTATERRCCRRPSVESSPRYRSSSYRLLP